MQSANYALSRAIRQRGIASSEVWSTRFYRAQAPANSTKPYAIYSFSSGIKPQNTPLSDAEFLITIKCVADEAATSETGAARIAELFDELGQNRVSTLVCTPDWVLVHSQLTTYVSYVENASDGAVQLFHDGAIFRFLLQKIT